MTTFFPQSLPPEKPAALSTSLQHPGLQQRATPAPLSSLSRSLAEVTSAQTPGEKAQTSLAERLRLRSVLYLLWTPRHRAASTETRPAWSRKGSGERTRSDSTTYVITLLCFKSRTCIPTAYKAVHTPSSQAGES